MLGKTLLPVKNLKSNLKIVFNFISVKRYKNFFLKNQHFLLWKYSMEKLLTFNEKSKIYHMRKTAMMYGIGQWIQLKKLVKVFKIYSRKKHVPDITTHTCTLLSFKLIFN